MCLQRWKLLQIHHQESFNWYYFVACLQRKVLCSCTTIRRAWWNFIVCRGKHYWKTAKKKAYRYKPNDQKIRLEILGVLLSDVPLGLIFCKSRDGLRQPISDLLPFMVILEKKFRLLDSNLSFSFFFRSCKTQWLFFYFFSLLTSFDESICASVLHQFLFLFHKIRSHHRAKLLIQTYRQKTRNPGHSKALRKELNWEYLIQAILTFAVGWSQ